MGSSAEPRTPKIPTDSGHQPQSVKRGSIQSAAYRSLSAGSVSMKLDT